MQILSKKWACKSYPQSGPATLIQQIGLQIFSNKWACKSYPKSAPANLIQEAGLRSLSQNKTPSLIQKVGLEILSEKWARKSYPRSGPANPIPNVGLQILSKNWACKEKKERPTSIRDLLSLLLNWRRSPRQTSPYMTGQPLPDLGRRGGNPPGLFFSTFFRQA
jgi:hypothetical protein